MENIINFSLIAFSCFGMLYSAFSIYSLLYINSGEKLRTKLNGTLPSSIQLHKKQSIKYYKDGKPAVHCQG